MPSHAPTPADLHGDIGVPILARRTMFVGFFEVFARTVE